MLVETYAYGTNRNLVCKIQKVKCSKIIKQRQMINMINAKIIYFNDVTNENIK